MDNTIEYLKSLFEKYKNMREEAGLDEKWKQNERQWLGRWDKDNRQSLRSKVFINLTKQAVDTAMSAISKTIFTGDWFDVQPVLQAEGTLQQIDKDKLKQKAHAIKEAFSYIMHMDKTKKKIKKVIRSMCVYGTGILMVYPFVNIKKTLKVSNQEDGTHILINEEKMVRPKTEVVNIYDFYTDISNPDLQNNAGIFYTYQADIDDLLKLQDEGIYENVDSLLTGDTLEVTEDINATGKEVHSSDEHRVTIWEFWGKVYDEKGRAVERKIVIAGYDDMEVVLQDIPNPFLTKRRPFILVNYEDTMDNIYGIGIPDMVAGIQSAINGIIRARLDNLALVNNVMYAVDTSKLDDTMEDLTVYPGKIWLVHGNPREAITQMIGQLINTDFQDIAILERFMQEVSGIPKIYAGQLPPRRQTATEASLQIQQASMVLNDVVENVEHDLLVPLLESFYEIMAQFPNEAEFVRVTGELVKLTPDDVIGQYRFWVRGRDLAIQRETKLQSLIQFAQFAMNSPYIRQDVLIKKIYESFGFTDEDILAPKNPQVLMLEKIVEEHPQLAQGILEWLQEVLSGQGQTGNIEGNNQAAGTPPAGIGNNPNPAMGVPEGLFNPNQE